MGISRKISSRKGRERKRIKTELRNILELFLYISLYFHANFPNFPFFFLFLSNHFGEKRERDRKGLDYLGNHGNADAAIINQLRQTIHQSLPIFVIHNVLYFINHQKSDVI